MKSARRPSNETARLRALRSLEILDTLPEPTFDDLVRLAAEICEVPIAMVTLVDDQRQWFKSIVGLDSKETDRNLAFCAHTILQDDVFVVPDATKDERFADNPFVAGDPDIRFYAGATLTTTTGHNVGAFCVIDRVPRTLTPLQTSALQILAKQVEDQLELRRVVRELARREEEVAKQRDLLVQLQRDRQQLTSLVVHDLKSPLASVLPNAEHLASDVALPAEAREIAGEIGMAANSMLRLVLDILDISRSTDGKLVPRLADVDLQSCLGEVETAARKRAHDHGQSIAVSAANESFRADPDLLRRVLENLVDNALKYGARRGVIRLSSRSSDAGFVELTVSDEGRGIPDAHKETIFDRYSQLEAGTEARTSRGLGLFFVRLAVEAHGGRIWVEDNQPRGAIFRIRLPVSKA